MSLKPIGRFFTHSSFTHSVLHPENRSLKEVRLYWFPFKNGCDNFGNIKLNMHRISKRLCEGPSMSRYWEELLTRRRRKRKSYPVPGMVLTPDLCSSSHVLTVAPNSKLSSLSSYRWSIVTVSNVFVECNFKRNTNQFAIRESILAETSTALTTTTDVNTETNPSETFLSKFFLWSKFEKVWKKQCCCCLRFAFTNWDEFSSF